MRRVAPVRPRAVASTISSFPVVVAAPCARPDRRDVSLRRASEDKPCQAGDEHPTRPTDDAHVGGHPLRPSRGRSQTPPDRPTHPNVRKRLARRSPTGRHPPGAVSAQRPSGRDNGQGRPPTTAATSPTRYWTLCSTWVPTAPRLPRCCVLTTTRPPAPRHAVLVAGHHRSRV